jgi:hypothetical protein
MRWQYRLQLAALTTLVLAVLFPVGIGHLAGVLQSAAALGLGWNLLQGVRLYRRHLHQPAASAG